MSSSQWKRRDRILALAIAVGTGVKLWLALTTFGTNDVRYWQVFMKHIAAHGSVAIYRDIPYYNHPPLMSGLLSLLRVITARAPETFPFLIRLLTIVADVASALLMFRLVRFAWDERRALVCAVGVGLSPILVLASGFHGNSDPLFMALVLLAAERLLIGASPIACALALGLACNIKLVPLLVAPVFFFHIRSWPARARFAATLSALLLLGYGYHMVAGWPFMKRNVFDYAGLPGIWGVTFFLKSGLPSITSHAWANVLKYLIGLIIAVRAMVAARTTRALVDPALRARQLLGSIGEAFFVFFLLTPGFGIHYLAWFGIAAYLMSPVGAVAFNVLGATFMFAVYHYWNHGFPWNIADSDRVGPWRPQQALFGQVTWLCLVTWFAIIVYSRIAAARVPRVQPAASPSP